MTDLQRWCLGGFVHHLASLIVGCLPFFVRGLVLYCFALGVVHIETIDVSGIRIIRRCRDTCDTRKENRFFAGDTMQCCCQLSFFVHLN